MTKDEKALVEWCIQSLTTDPKAWQCDEYRCSHPSGVSVWIANSHYGMSIDLDGDRVLGGVNSGGSLFGPLISWRRRLRKAALACSGESRAGAAIRVITEWEARRA